MKYSRYVIVKNGSLLSFVLFSIILSLSSVSLAVGQESEYLWSSADFKARYTTTFGCYLDANVKWDEHQLLCKDEQKQQENYNRTTQYWNYVFLFNLITEQTQNKKKTTTLLS